MTLLEHAKAAARVSHAALDEAEIMPLIDAAKKELAITGIVKLDEDDPLIIRAVTAYVKAHFGYDNPEAEKFERTFCSLRNTMSQLSEYTTPRRAGRGRR